MCGFALSRSRAHGSQLGDTPGEGEKFAGFWWRAVALALDFLVFFAAAMILAVSQGFLVDPLGTADTIGPWFDTWWASLVGLLYFALLESSPWQGTPGKWLLNLEVTGADGAGIGPLRSLWRNVAKYLSGFIFPVSIGLAVLERKRRTPHDFLAGTRVTRRARRPPGFTQWWRRTLVVAALGLAALPFLQRYGRWACESPVLRTRSRAAFPSQLEPLPALSGGLFFERAHADCFPKAYQLSWIWNAWDPAAYRRCMDTIYARRLERLAVLREVGWQPFRDATWAHLEYEIRVTEGRLPLSGLVEERLTRCDTGGYSSTGGSIQKSDIRESGPGLFTVRTLIGLQKKPCELVVRVGYQRWPLAPDLVVTTPTPDPARVAAEEHEQRRRREIAGRREACFTQVLGRLGPTETDSTDPGLERALGRLRSQDAGTQRLGLEELTHASPGAARPILRELVEILASRSTQVDSDLLAAISRADPSGTHAGAALRCLLDNPLAYDRQLAAVGLLRLGDPAGLMTLAAELGQPDKHARLGVLRHLHFEGELAQGVLPTLVKVCAGDLEAEVRRECVGTMARVGPQSAGMAQTLATLGAKDPDPEVRARAKEQLERLRVDALLKAQGSGASWP